MSATATADLAVMEPGSLEERYRESAAIRGVGNGFSWSIAWLFGFVPWPFLAVGLQQHTGSFAAAFLLIPGVMAWMAIGVWRFIPEHAGRELDEIAT